jgi:hypothetical protein
MDSFIMIGFQQVKVFPNMGFQGPWAVPSDERSHKKIPLSDIRVAFITDIRAGG